MTAVVRSISGSSIESPIDIQTIALDAWVGRRLRIRQEWLGVSDQELCVALRIDCDEISAYQSGKKRIGANRLFRVAKLLDVPLNYFFQGYPGYACPKSFAA
jgi:cobalamin biosynthesis protein CbiG